MSNASNNRADEVKREDFRKYLEHAGVMDALTQALLSLYGEPEKPTDAIGFIKKQLVSPESKEQAVDVDALKKELCDAKMEIEELRRKLSKCTTPDETAAVAPV